MSWGKIFVKAVNAVKPLYRRFPRITPLVIWVCFWYSKLAWPVIHRHNDLWHRIGTWVWNYIRPRSRQMSFQWLAGWELSEDSGKYGPFSFFRHTEVDYSNVFISGPIGCRWLLSGLDL